uniref:protein-serine/threonine phosphatase n=1 Tax=Sinocyclocheilus anshuiensis TaxID=1608454 RepID=A0A671S0R5_9TELE
MALVTVQRSPTPSATSSPCVSESGSGEDDRRSQPRSISESFLTVKGAALFLPRGNGSSSSSCSSRITAQRSKHAGDLQQHLQTMFTLLRPEDNIRLAVRLESAFPQCTRYMVVVSTNGRQDTEESVVLGMDFNPSDRFACAFLFHSSESVSLLYFLHRGFSVSTDNKIHIFKPVSVQAMWSALQSLHKACEVARCHNYFPGSLFLTWVSYYQSRVSSDQACINEWNAMQDVQSHRADSPVLFSEVPTERERTERLIKTRLREIMMQKDLENVTSKDIRTELEMQMVCNLREFKEYIDNEMIIILGQMDRPTEIFEHVYLGSEWNASNLEELQNTGVQYILNVTREIDNFFPSLFEYHNIRVYDEEATDLLAYWNDTYKFISRAKKAGAKCLVHCKMGVSRSASTVIAYAMKEYGWDLEQAFGYVKERRVVTKPNPSFMRQLEEYQGILMASKQRHNKLWRSHSDSDLSEHHEPLCKATAAQSLGRSNSRNQTFSQTSPSLQDFLQTLTPTSASATEAKERTEPDTTSWPDTHIYNGLGKPDDNLHEPTEMPSLPRPRAESCSVSVHNTVSEKESIRHSVTLPPPPISQPVSSSSSEEEEFTQATSAEAEKEKVEHGKDQQSDWPKGTVRRATRELEQKIKQEVSSATLVTLAPACPSRRSPVNTSSREKTEETSSQTHLTPNPSTVSTRHHQPQNNTDKVEKDESLSADEDRTGRESERPLREGERMNTGLTHSRQSHSISSSSSLAMVLQLEGITEQESYTDSDCLPGRCPKYMRETWETLKELGAFLWQVSGCSDRRLSQPWSRREQRKGRAARERTKEVEARIRQAGLTPPSMMKRSASLAKLGSLELSPVDLSELDLSPVLLSAPTSKPRSHLFSDDTSKKKRVLPHCTPALPSSSNDDETEEAEYSDCDVVPMPLPLSPPSNQCWRRDNAQEAAGYAPLPAPALIPVATRQQYGRTHPLRRLKKRTINPYHTM